MKPVLLSLALGAFLYCQGFQAQVIAQHTPTPYNKGIPPSGYIVPSPRKYGYDSPSPRYGYESPVYGTPSPVYGTPSPVYGGESPSPVYGGESPSPVYGGESPSPVYGGESPSPVYGTHSPVYGNPGDGQYPHGGAPGTYPGDGTPKGENPHGGKPPKDGYPGVPSGCQTGSGSGPNHDGQSQDPGNPTDGNNGNPGDGSGNPGDGSGNPGDGSGNPGDGSNDNGGLSPPGDLSPPGGLSPPPPNPTCPQPVKGPLIKPVGKEAFTTNPATAYNFPAGQCQTQCTRKSVKDWTPEQWCLYQQLYLEMNRRGYMGDMVSIHSGTGFHGTVAFFPWHRFYLAHFEQLMQKIDHEINPGRAEKSEEFCLGYWDWRTSDDLRGAYDYLFKDSAVGSLPEGLHNIPGGAFKDLQVNGQDKPTTRNPDPPRGQNFAWRPTEQDECDRKEFGEEDEDSMHVCWELLHGFVHTQVGGTVEPLTGTMTNASISPADPVFLLHHTMVDYVWNKWEQKNSKYPASFGNNLPAPYDKWVMNDAIDTNKFCANYGDKPLAAKVNVRSTPAPSFAPISPGASAPTPSPVSDSVSTNFNRIAAPLRSAVQKILDAGKPKVLSRSEFNKQNAFMVKMHSPEKVDKLYSIYVLNAEKAQKKFDLVSETYSSSYSQASSSSISADRVSPTESTSPSGFPSGPNAFTTSDKLADPDVIETLQNLADL